jgi:putative hydrolase of the HAD superfamily
MVKAVLFDLDGTLLNRDVSLERFIKSQHQRLNSPLGHIPIDQYSSRFIELDAKGYVWKDKVYAQLVKEFSIIHLNSDDLLNDYIENFKYSCVGFLNLIHTLTELKHHNITLGMITNGKGKFQLDNIRALGIEDFFDTILVSESINLRKPDPRIFEVALCNLNVAPCEAVFVGDHPINDVEAARNVGMVGVWKKDSGWADNVEADFIIDDLIELIDFLNNRMDVSKNGKR